MGPRAFLLLLFLAPLARAQRVLLVDLDDVGWDLVDRTPTPTLDRLSAEGRTFTRFFTHPLCSPTRASLYQGAYASHPDVLCGTPVNPNGQYELPLAPLESLAQLVSRSQLTTAKIGKWHLCPDARATHPNESGWRYYAGNLENLRASSGESYYGYRKVTQGQWSWVDGYLTTDETDDGIACLQAGFDLVSVSYHSVHVPFHVPPPGLYSGPPPFTDEEKGRAMLMALDQELGRLIDVARTSGYTVFVLSDNGTDDDIGGEKGQVTPGGVNVPMWALGPGVVPGVDGELAHVADLYATVCDLLGVARTLPERQGPDSSSLAGRLQGSSTPTRTLVYTDRWMPNGNDPRDGLPSGNKWRRALRVDGWSLVVDDKDDEGVHLYRYTDDLREEEDLIPSGLDPLTRLVYRSLWSKLLRL